MGRWNTNLSTPVRAETSKSKGISHLLSLSRLRSNGEFLFSLKQQMTPCDKPNTLKALNLAACMRVSITLEIVLTIPSNPLASSLAWSSVKPRWARCSLTRLYNLARNRHLTIFIRSQLSKADNSSHGSQIRVKEGSNRRMERKA